MTKEELKTHRHNLHALFLRSKSRSDQITCHEIGKLLDLLIEGCEIVDVEKYERTGFVSKRKLKEAILKMEELKKEGNSFAECADECIKILREVIT